MYHRLMTEKCKHWRSSFYAAKLGEFNFAPAYIRVQVNFFPHCCAIPVTPRENQHQRRYWDAEKTGSNNSCCSNGKQNALYSAPVVRTEHTSFSADYVHGHTSGNNNYSNNNHYYIDIVVERQHKQNVVFEGIAFIPRIWLVPGSNLDRIPRIPRHFVVFLKAQYAILGHGRFLPHPFRFIIHRSSNAT